jgi:ATP-dependent Lhr-like helicase
MKQGESVLKQFHPLVAEWFTTHIGVPTDLQEQAWPGIAAGENLLISAPTGSGKTLAAFLWAIDQLITLKWSLGRARVLYVSPLKALNSDVRRNLLRPLAELDRVFAGAGEPFPAIGVAVRSGDTPQSERRRMQRNPPEILITTPESLNLLLSSQGGRTILTDISTVILDEIHAVVDGKRGVHLITAVDRLVQLSGEFQRIALSATVRPLQTVAEFVGGYIMEGTPRNPRYFPRRVRIVEAAQKKEYRLNVRFPEEARNWNNRDSFWQPFVAEIKGIVARNRSTLVFTNSRRLCEKITHLINQNEPAPLAYAHHGSLSREIRTEVERKLKAGELRAIVATSSLELGIDIGALDEVVLVRSAPSFSAAIQRIGRAGHGVGEVSRGTLLPIEPQDIMESAILADGVLNQDIEAVRPVQSPLDILAQIMVSMVGVETGDIDELYARLRASTPYRSLSRQQFDLVLNMLAGRYAGSRLRELKPRIAIDRMNNTAAARKGALQDLYFSGGTIPDRGYFHLRHQQNGARIGELDEEFVWEAKIGQAFTLGTQNWKIERITHNDVLVLPAHPGAAAPPFWKAEENLREFHLSERIGRFLETADDRLEDPQFRAYLEKNHCLDAVAAEQLITFLRRQKEETGCRLPHRRHLVIEHVRTGPGGYPGNQIVVHTVWGGRVNRPFAMALEAAWEQRYGYRPEVYPSNDCIVLQLPNDVSGDDIVSLVRSSTVQHLLKKKLEGSGFFGARFRECAGRALLLTRRKMNERMPLWLNRLRSQKLLESMLSSEDFPILLETWRTCLRDEFDLNALVAVLTELESGAVAWSETYTMHPSPMALSVTWPQINQYVYMGDEMRSGKSSRLRSDLLNEVVLSPELRPAAPIELAAQFETKRQRLAAGYSPDSALDLIEWVKERLLLPFSEWERLLSAIESDHQLDAETLLTAIAGRLVVLKAPGASESLIAAVEELPRIIFGFYGTSAAVGIESPDSKQPPSAAMLEDPELAGEDPDAVCLSLLSQWLQYYSPKTVEDVHSRLGLDRVRLESAIEGLIDAERLLTGQLLQEASDEMICDRDNYEILLRMLRVRARPAFEPLRPELLPLFLATFQGIAEPEKDMEGLLQRIEQLICRPAAAELWESEIFPARMKSYDSAWLDSILQQNDLCWVGSGNRRICFCFEPDLDLLQEETQERGSEPRLPGQTEPVEEESKADGGSAIADLFAAPFARYDFSALLRLSGLNPAKLGKKIWDAVWRAEVTNDTYAALRRGIENNFQVRNPAQETSQTRSTRRRHSGRAVFGMWKGSLPVPGNWRCIAWPERQDDILDAEERNKDRARLLLDRYGILFRELLQNELPVFSWSKIFRALRLMELAGEVLTGYFFDGVPGPQFISPRAFRMLQRNLSRDAIYWVAATDPASVCGLRLDALRGKLTRRAAGSHLVFHGHRIVLESRRSGKTLVFYVPESEPDLQSYLGLFHHMLNRNFQPMRRVVVEKINGVDAARSPYADVFRIGFDVDIDFKNLVLFRRYSPESSE